MPAKKTPSSTKKLAKTKTTKAKTKKPSPAKKATKTGPKKSPVSAHQQVRITQHSGSRLEESPTNLLSDITPVGDPVARHKLKTTTNLRKSHVVVDRPKQDDVDLADLDSLLDEFMGSGSSEHQSDSPITSVNATKEDDLPYDKSDISETKKSRHDIDFKEATIAEEKALENSEPDQLLDESETHQSENENYPQPKSVPKDIRNWATYPVAADDHLNHDRQRASRGVYLLELLFILTLLAIFLLILIDAELIDIGLELPFDLIQ